MADKDAAPEAALPVDDEPPAAAPAPRRGMGHRGADVRDTVAEMTARAHEISLEAGSKMTGVIRDVINAASGLAEFAIESARDLVQYMVRRGQMSQEDGDQLLREAEEAQSRRIASRPAAETAPPQVQTPSTPPELPAARKPAVKKAAEPEAEQPVAPSAPAAAKQAAPAVKKVAVAKVAAKAPTKEPTRSPAAKTPPAKAPAKPSAPKAPAVKTPASKGAAKKAAIKKR